MTVSHNISLQIIKKEIENCKTDPIIKNLKYSDLNEENLSFTVELKSSVDDNIFIMELCLDNYKELPPYIEFIDSETRERGIKHAYPKGPDGFFHDKPCICNPCSRKAYVGYSDLHKEWKINSWQQIPEVNSLTDLKSIIKAVNNRINNPLYYSGRMG